jgi:hypothetical protein
MPIASCSIPAGSSSTEGWAVVLDASDLAALPAVDIKAAGSTVIDGKTFTLDNPTKCSQMELDGATGLIMSCDATEFGWLYDWSPSSYWSGSFLRTEIDQIIAGWNGSQQFAIQWLWASISGQSNYYDGAGLWLAEDPVPTGPGQLWGAHSEQFNPNPSRVEFSKGGAPYAASNTFQPFWEVIYPQLGRAPIARAGAWPGTWEEPGKWPAVGEGVSTLNTNLQTPQAGAPMLSGGAKNCFGFHPNQRNTGDGPITATLTGFRVLIP